MGFTDRQWKYGGAVLLAAISSVILVPGGMNIWVPMPFYIVLLAWLTLFLFPFLTPGIYLLVLKFFSQSKHFSLVVLTLIVTISVLNLIYFRASWGYGLQYQGAFHTKMVAIENFIGFGIALLFAFYAHVKKFRSGIYSANFLLFAVLSWCAFPYLGEMP